MIFFSWKYDSRTYCVNISYQKSHTICPVIVFHEKHLFTASIHRSFCTHSQLIFTAVQTSSVRVRKQELLTFCVDPDLKSARVTIRTCFDVKIRTCFAPSSKTSPDFDTTGATNRPNRANVKIWTFFRSCRTHAHAPSVGSREFLRPTQAPASPAAAATGSAVSGEGGAAGRASRALSSAVARPSRKVCSFPETVSLETVISTSSSGTQHAVE
jgi:hypothetical protein